MLKNRTRWQAAYWILFAIFVATAALNMAHVKAGFFTSYAADLFLPPWLYIAMRRLASPAPSRNPLSRWLGSSPELAALSLFIASSMTELSQIYWPKGIFRGTFDRLDLLAYAAGLFACYLLDRRQVRFDISPEHSARVAEPL